MRRRALLRVLGFVAIAAALALPMAACGRYGRPVRQPPAPQPSSEGRDEDDEQEAAR
jgi:predicted small lipoprotein YifL